MHKILIIFLVTLTFSNCAKAAQTKQTSADQEIRNIICQIKTGNYAAAQNDLEKILRQDPLNIYVWRLLPGVMAHQIKKEDKSPENIAQIRKTIEAYQKALKNPQVSSREKTEIDNYVITLYEKISDEEKVKELLKRVEDKNQTSESRSKFYSILADQPRKCADEAVPRYINNPSDKTEIEKAKSCVSKGLDYVNKAILLDANNEYAWVNKGSLLGLASKIAELENNRTQKNLLKKQTEDAVKQFRIIAKKNDENSNSNPTDTEPSGKKYFSKEVVAKELVKYEFEIPLDKLVDRIYIPLDALVAPLPIDDESTDEGSETFSHNINSQKGEWKEFSPSGEEISVELPDNVNLDSYGEITIYTVENKGIKYMIFSQSRPSFQDSSLDDPALNTLAWTFVSNFSNQFPEHSFEVKLVNKELIAGQPGRIYSYVLDSCLDKRNGTFFTIAGKKRNYIIDVQGAELADKSVQRFLKSLNFTSEK